MDRKNFGWRGAMNDTGAKIEERGEARDARLGLKRTARSGDEPEPGSSDVWWSIALAHVFLAVAVVMILVRSCAG